ncbi:Pentatricopeptide repeat-containing protein [Platanthera zijinensis]|uniref:Pentatricopeptide repeat-containing protein n=1 Tax=Platanthera zijinensis TaxID=2320716 RepID=A0AAP0G945_9ASPA
MEAMQQLHAHLIASGLHRSPFHISKVLAITALSPTHLPRALNIFNQIENPNIFIFNTMLRAFAPSDTPTGALLLYGRSKFLGLKQDRFTFPFVLMACARISSITEGQWVHAHALKLGFISDPFVSNSLIHFYSTWKDFLSARQVFDELSTRDLVSWNSLISACVKDQRYTEALELFEIICAEKVQADVVTMVNVITACTKLGDLARVDTMVKYLEGNCLDVDAYLGNTLIDYYGRRGMVDSARKVFDEMKERNSMTVNAMITTYAKGGELIAAKRLFDNMRDRNLISWSSMIAGYSQSNHFSEALELFRQMVNNSKIKPDEILVVSLLSACAHLIAHNSGRSIHGYILRSSIKFDVFVGNSLIDMYSKCGYINEARQVFEEMSERDTTTWNSIILGLATGGYADTALHAFSNMLRNEYRPDKVTFLGVLIACVHSGSIKEGLEHFNNMSGVHGVEPEMMHYGCVVDLLSRAGELDKALEFIGEMLRRPDAIVWRALLGASKVHGNVRMAEHTNKKVMDLDPRNCGNYVLLSNAYVTDERWNDAMKIREMMREVCIQKSPGCSIV